MAKIGSSTSRGYSFDFFMEADRFSIAYKDKKKPIYDEDIKSGYYGESSQDFHYLDFSFLDIEIQKDVFETSEPKIIIPETVLKTRNVIRKMRKNDENRRHYRFFYTLYEEYGAVEFSTFHDLFVIWFDGKTAIIEDADIECTDKGIRIPANIKEIPANYIYIPEEILKYRDIARKENERKRRFKIIAETDGFSFILNEDKLIVKHDGKEATCTEIISVYGRPAVNVESLGLDHPFLELPGEVEEAFRKVLGTKVPEGLELVPCGKSLLDGAEYFKLNKPIPEGLFKRVKMYFEYFGEESDDFSGWLTREPGRVADVLKIEV